MSSVYEAAEPDGTRIAVKVLDEGLARNPGARARFLREAWVGSAVDHPGAARVIATEETPDGRLLLGMELLRGHTVRHCCEASGGRLEDGEAIRIAVGVLDVLAAAHARGIVHRDIKPENVFLTESCEVKVLDFGVAALRDEANGDASITQSGAAIGTPAFMAPEQARGRHSQVDARTDVWAVGATLYFSLTGRLVHESAGTRNEALILAGTRRAPSIVALRPDLPRRVRAVVDRALAFDPADRWPSASAMRLALLESVQEEAGVVETQPGTTERTLEVPPRPPAPARRALGYALAAAGGLAIALVATGLQFREQRAPARSYPLAARVEASKPPPEQPIEPSNAATTTPEPEPPPARAQPIPARLSKARARNVRPHAAALPSASSLPKLEPVSDDLLDRRR
jgi:eukaryotic-like serine/threonine-protein kinase